MDGLPSLAEGAAFRRRELATMFFKCTRWQVEETADAADCRYHYFCDSAYPGDYPPIVDLFVLLFAITSYISTAAFTAMKATISNQGIGLGRSKRRYLVPSGPIALPLLLLILWRGQRINTLFPLSRVGPALLHLVHVSALAFENQADKSLRHAVLEASTVSGILHASLYLDSIVLPYYTGLEALTRSTFSGECASCVCRRDALVVGGRLVSYRGWSKATISVVGTLCARMLFRIFGEGRSGLLMMKMMMEGLSWVLIATDSISLMVIVPEGGVLDTAAYGGVCALITLDVLIKASSSFWAWLEASHPTQNGHNNV